LRFSIEHTEKLKHM